MSEARMTDDDASAFWGNGGENTGGPEYPKPDRPASDGANVPRTGGALKFAMVVHQKPTAGEPELHVGYGLINAERVEAIRSWPGKYRVIGSKNDREGTGELDFVCDVLLASGAKVVCMGSIKYVAKMLAAHQ